MEKVRTWCGQPLDRGRLKNRTDCSNLCFLCGAHKLMKTTFKLQEDEVDRLEAVNSDQLDGFLLITAAWNDQPQQLTRQLQMTFLLLQRHSHITL